MNLPATGIALRNGTLSLTEAVKAMTIKHLKEVNNIKDVDKIKPGMVLKYF